MTLEFNRYVELIPSLTADIDRLVASTDPGTTVPGCPDWDEAELRDHVGGVLAFWTAQLRQADPGAAGPNFPEEVRDRYRLPLAELGAELMAELQDAGPDRGCWNWSGANLRSAWVARRMANEFAVHHADAQATAGVATGAPVVIEADIAADGIDEFIEVFLAPEPDEPFDPIGVVRFEAASQGQWLAEVGNGVRLVEGGPDLDVAAELQGRADQILLRLWGRPNEAAPSGDKAPMQQWDRLVQSPR